jgi:hypothetical protein
MLWGAAEARQYTAGSTRSAVCLAAAKTRGKFGHLGRCFPLSARARYGAPLPPWRLLGVAAHALASLSAGLLDSACNQCTDPCPQQYSVIDFCLIGDGAASACDVDRVALKHCEPGSCGFFDVMAGQTFTFPAAAIWPVLGSRDDLHISAYEIDTRSSSPADAGSDASVAGGGVKVLYDGVEATGCSGDPTRAPLICSNVPRSVQTISIVYAVDAFQVDVTFQDDECRAANRVCER